MKIAQLEGAFVCRQVQIDEEQRVVGDPAECSLGNFIFPTILRAGGDALT
jgi:hypothetical protein